MTALDTYATLVAACCRWNGEHLPWAPAAPAPGGPPSSNVTIVSEAANRFAFNLYGQLKGEAGNLFFSPQSIQTALAMAYCGARGETGRQMVSVMGFQEDRPIRPEWMAAACGEFLAALRGDGKPRAYELSAANALWGQKGYGFLPDYLALLDRSFGAGLREVDFAADTEGSRRTINAWVEKETREKIKDLIPQGILTSLTRLVLTNAIYFKGDWASAFNKADTRDEDFFAAAGRAVKVPMMHQTAQFGYCDGGDFQAIEMTYKGDALSMVVLLPKAQDGLAAIEKTLSAETVAGYTAKLSRHNVQVAMPKFKITGQFMLKEPLAAMGMRLAFDIGGNADLSGMNGRQDLYITAVVHKAFVDVNEEGTEAAAATGVVVGLRSARPEPIPVFRADHPFLFLIRERKSGCILFMGRLANPKQ
ncbi:MAG: serpin family protein [Planctomycetota bacterium]|nr:serpin family protein [Planctomycetota bacterium]